MATSINLRGADEIRVGGARLNGAFILSPEDIQFGGSGATLRVEFSEDDSKAFGMPYTVFRAPRLVYPNDYPTNKEAARVELISSPSPSPIPIRIENGRQIYAVTIPITQLGGVYDAVPDYSPDRAKGLLLR